MRQGELPLGRGAAIGVARRSRLPDDRAELGPEEPRDCAEGSKKDGVDAPPAPDAKSGCRGNADAGPDGAGR